MSALEPTYLESPAQISGQELRSAYEGLQEGVVGAGDLKVAAAGGTREVSVAAGVALILGDAVTDQGLYRARNDAAVSSNTATAGAFEAGGIPAADATNPRIDQIVARIYDTSHDASGLRKWRLEVISGTATGGATLDNRTGAAALPAGAVRLADVLVPAGATTIIAGNVRDRRPWARGAFRRLIRTAGDYSTSSATYAALDATNLAPRIECSGLPLRVSLLGSMLSSGSTHGYVRLLQDGAAVDERQSTFAASAVVQRAPTPVPWVVVPAAGSHVFSFDWRSTAALSITMFANATNPLVLAIEELVMQNADNT